MKAEERIAEDCASVPLRAAGFVSKPISSHVPVPGLLSRREG